MTNRIVLARVPRGAKCTCTGKPEDVDACRIHGEATR